MIDECNTVVVKLSILVFVTVKSNTHFLMNYGDRFLPHVSLNASNVIICATTLGEASVVLLQINTSVLALHR